jgi:dienelactone hydrolase
MPIEPGELRNFTCRPFAFGGRQYDTYRRGDGPGVILMHEIPGVTPELLGLGEREAEAGFHVVLPSFFGTPGRPAKQSAKWVQLARVRISREFNALAANKTGAVVDWLRALARLPNRR